MSRTNLAQVLGQALTRLYPEARCTLDYRDPFELLVATILSAQCTDERVNQVTSALFDRFPNASALAEAETSELERLIYSTGFFRAKTRHLIDMAKILVEKHQAVVPAEFESLKALPGVGRKTAHVVLGNAFGIPSGVVVDTHVKRLAFRLGLTESTDPARVERDLATWFPNAEWVNLSHRLIQHGRIICQAARPQCEICPLSDDCPKRGVNLPTPKSRRA